MPLLRACLSLPARLLRFLGSWQQANVFLVEIEQKGHPLGLRFEITLAVSCVNRLVQGLVRLEQHSLPEEELVPEGLGFGPVAGKGDRTGLDFVPA